MPTISTPAIAPLLAATDGIPDNLLPVIIGGMAIAVLAIGIAYTAIVTDARIERSRHEAIRAALEKGVPIPEELMTPAHRRSHAGGNPGDEDRRRGIITVFVSVGIFIFLTMLGVGNFAYVATIPGLVGLALLANWWLDRKQTHPGKSQSDDPARG
jgi:hypothetical protein